MFMFNVFFSSVFPFYDPIFTPPPPFPFSSLIPTAFCMINTNPSITYAELFKTPLQYIKYYEYVPLEEILQRRLSLVSSIRTSDVGAFLSLKKENI